MILTEELKVVQFMGMYLKRKKKLPRVEASLRKCSMLPSDDHHPRIWKKSLHEITDLYTKF